MGLIEAILAGIQLKGLQKPIVFFSMLVGFVCFVVFGAVILFGLFQWSERIDEIKIIPIISTLCIVFIFWGLATLCGYFIKRCFD